VLPILVTVIAATYAGHVSAQVAPYAVPVATTAPTPGEIAVRQAAEPSTGAPVADQARADYDPIGEHVGDFLVFPSMGTSISFNDNLFAQAQGTRSDELVELTPQIAAVSDWGRHELDVLVSGRLDRFVNFPDQDIEAGQARAHGHFDISHDDQADLLTFVQHDASPRAVSEGRIAGPPELFNVYGATASYEHWFDRLATKTSVSIQQLNYDSPLDNDLQRGNDIAVERLSYEIDTGVAAYLQSSYNVSRYALEGFERDTDVWTTLVGTRFDIDSVFVGEFGIGELRQAYRDPVLGVHAGLAIDGQVTWNVTQLTSLILSARRNDTPTRIILEATGAAADRTDTTVSLEVQHDLHHNILLKADLSYQDSAYAQLGGSQDTRLGSLGMRYFASRALSIDTTFSYISRTALPSAATVRSGLNLGAFDQAILAIAVITQF
jgi:hypothetical protein